MNPRASVMSAVVQSSPTQSHPPRNSRCHPSDQRTSAEPAFDRPSSSVMRDHRAVDIPSIPSDAVRVLFLSRQATCQSPLVVKRSTKCPDEWEQGAVSPGYCIIVGVQVCNIPSEKHSPLPGRKSRAATSGRRPGLRKCRQYPCRRNHHASRASRRVYTPLDLAVYRETQS